MANLIMSDENLQWLWRKKFTQARLLTLDDLLYSTIERGKDLSELLFCLDESILPGIYCRVVKRFIDQEVKDMLSKIILNDPDFDIIFSDPRKYFGVNDDDVIRNLCTERYKCDLNHDSPENMKRAIISFIELGLGNFKDALSNAEFAVNESRIPNFCWEINNRTLTSTNELVRVAKITALVTLEVAREMQS